MGEDAEINLRSGGFKRGNIEVWHIGGGMYVLSSTVCYKAVL